MKHTRRFVIRIALACALATALTPRLADAQRQLAFEEIAPPVEDSNAIKLSGKSKNSTPETWLRMRGAKAPAWWLGPCGSLVIRNVSQAALIPFLPDPAKATGGAVILAPGGGTLVHCMDTQYQIAKWLNERGIAAFVLKYRLVPTPKDVGAFLDVVERHQPMLFSDVVSEQTQIEESANTHEDGLEAMRYLRTNASKWNLSTDHIGFIGFSAGGFTATGVALQADGASRPDAVALIYGVMPGDFTVSASAPPIFIAATSDDPLYSIGGSVDPYLSTYRAWQHAKVPAELHMFGTGGHGFGVTPRGKSSDQWLALLDNWLRDRGFAGAGSAVRP